MWASIWCIPQVRQRCGRLSSSFVLLFGHLIGLEQDKTCCDSTDEAVPGQTLETSSQKQGSGSLVAHTGQLHLLETLFWAKIWPVLKNECLQGYFFILFTNTRLLGPRIRPEFVVCLTWVFRGLDGSASCYARLARREGWGTCRQLGRLNSAPSKEEMVWLLKKAGVAHESKVLWRSQ